MNRYRTSREAGFTITEVLVALVITCMVIAALSLFVFQASTMWVRAVSESMAQQRAMSAVGKIAYIARRSSNWSVHDDYASGLIVSNSVDEGDCLVAIGPNWTTWVYKTSGNNVLWQRDAGAVLSNALLTRLQSSPHVFSACVTRVAARMDIMDTARGGTMQLISVTASFNSRNKVQPSDD